MKPLKVVEPWPHWSLEQRAKRSILTRFPPSQMQHQNLDHMTIFDARIERRAKMHRKKTFLNFTVISFSINKKYRYHIYCVGLRRVPQGRWHCQECAVCASCGSREPGGANSDRNSVAQWQHEYKKGDKNTRVYVSTLCVPCSK